MTKNQRLMQAAGRALWGPQYRFEMARELGNGLRTIMRWDAGERPVPVDKMERLQVLLIGRQDEIAKLLEVLS